MVHYNDLVRCLFLLPYRSIRRDHTYWSVCWWCCNIFYDGIILYCSNRINKYHSHLYAAAGYYCNPILWYFISHMILKTDQLIVDWWVVAVASVLMMVCLIVGWVNTTIKVCVNAHAHCVVFWVKFPYLTHAVWFCPDHNKKGRSQNHCSAFFFEFIVETSYYSIYIYI